MVIMPNYLLWFSHLDKDANTRHDSVIVEAESEEEARAALHASTWERLSPHIVSVHPTALPADRLRPLRRPGRPRTRTEPHRPVYLQLPDALMAAVEAQCKASSETLTDWITAAIRAKIGE